VLLIQIYVISKQIVCVKSVKLKIRDRKDSIDIFAIEKQEDSACLLSNYCITLKQLMDGRGARFDRIKKSSIDSIDTLTWKKE